MSIDLIRTRAAAILARDPDLPARMAREAELLREGRRQAFCECIRIVEDFEPVTYGDWDGKALCESLLNRLRALAAEDPSP